MLLMNIYSRFKKLTIWNKIAVIGPVGILSFVCMFLICYSQKSDMEKINEKLDRLDKICSAAQEDPRLGSEIMEKKYELGYAIVIIDGERYSIDKCVQSPQFENFDVDWSTAAVLDFNLERVLIRAPDIMGPQGIGFRGISVGALRKPHNEACFIEFPRYELWFEMVINKENYSVGVIGVKKT